MTVRVAFVICRSQKVNFFVEQSPFLISADYQVSKLDQPIVLSNTSRNIPTRLVTPSASDRVHNLIYGSWGCSGDTGRDGFSSHQMTSSSTPALIATCLVCLIHTISLIFSPRYDRIAGVKNLQSVRIDERMMNRLVEVID